MSSTSNSRESNPSVSEHPHLDRFDLSSLFQTALVPYCKDYSVLKSLQQTSSRLHGLLACPSQQIWRQLCRLCSYSKLFSKERLLSKKLIWESVYFQNWSVMENWEAGRYEIRAVDFHDRSVELLKDDSVGPSTRRSSIPRIMLAKSSPRKESLVTFLTTHKALYQSSLDFSLWDLGSGVQVVHQIIFEKDEVTASVLCEGKLVLGHSSGKLQVINVHQRRIQFSERYHDAQITAIKVATNGDIFTADMHGSVKLNGKECLRCDANVISIIGRDPVVVVAVDGQVLQLTGHGRAARSTNLGMENVNCAVLDESGGGRILVAGTDDGQLIYYDLDAETRMVACVKEDTPITSLCLTSTHLMAGTFTGHILVYRWPDLRLLFEDSNHRAPIWSLVADEENLMSSAVDSSPVLRRRFLLA